MISLLVFLFILGILIIVHEFGHFIIAKRMGVRVEKFSLGFGPKLWSKKIKDTEYTVSLVPLGGYVKMAGDSLEEYKGSSGEYFNKTPLQRAAIVFCGPLLNYLMGILCFWMVFVIGYPTLTSKVGGLLDGFGAQEAGIRPGDKIVSVDGKIVDYWEELQGIIQAKLGAAAVTLSILRDGKLQELEVRIREEETDDVLGQRRSIALLGITPLYSELVKVRYGFFESFFLSIKRSWGLTVLTYKSLWRMIVGKISLRESVTGPLGIFMITSRAANEGLVAVLNLVGLLSISLGIFNLLPFPVLDGGHILFLAIEKIRGRYFSAKTERIITQVGLSAIILFAVIVTYNDILRFGGKIFQWFK